VVFSLVCPTSLDKHLNKETVIVLFGSLYENERNEPVALWSGTVF
jgi:hypothetical protein